MLMCDLCDKEVPDGYVLDHMIKHHHDKLQEWAYFHMYEWDGSDPNDDVPTAAELNQGGVGW